MRIVATGLQFPEGPIAMPDCSVLLVETARETLTRITPDGRVEVVAQVPGGPNGAAVGPDGKIYICNNGGLKFIREGTTCRSDGQSETYRSGSIEVVDPSNGKVERLYDRCGDFQLKGPNDLVFDADGGFWFTDFGKRRARDFDRGFVFWARTDGSAIREVIPRMFQPNGVGLSPDGRTLYVAETHSGRLWSFEITGPGVATQMLPDAATARLSNWTYPPGPATSVPPYGDGQGRRRSVPEGPGIFETAPDGSYARYHKIPDLLVTNLCFGGPDLRTALVTCGYEGRVVAVDWHEPGHRLIHQSPTAGEVTFRSTPGADFRPGGR